MAAEVEQRFESAVEVIQSLPKKGSFQPSYEMMARFYGLFKQARNGPCTGSRPGFWDVVGRAKFDAWHSLGDMPKLEAMENYVEELKKIVEVMPQTEIVENFTRSLGQFYELVDLDKPTATRATSEQSAMRTPSPIVGSSSVLPSNGDILAGHAYTAECTESDESDSDVTDDQFADTLAFQPNQNISVSDQGLDVIMLAIDRLQNDVSELAVRLGNIEKLLADLSKQDYKINLKSFGLRNFRIPRRIGTLVKFLLPIIVGYLLTKRFILYRRR